MGPQARSAQESSRSERVAMVRRGACAGVIAVAFAGLACGSGRYVEPGDGPSGRLSIASTCVERATFYARIDGLRTEELGCNQSGSWRLSPGLHEVVVQVRQASYRIEPMTIAVSVGAGECDAYLLRQVGGFELVPIAEGNCE